MPVFGGGVITLEMNGGGTIAVYTATDDPLGDNPNGDVQLFSIAVGAIAPFQISENTADVFSFTGSFDVDDAGAEVVFVSTQDLVGTNPGNAYNIFRATVDGSTITQVTNSTTGFVRQVKISGDGSVIVFTTDSDLTGGNPLNDLQVFSMNADGTNIAQVTIGATFAEKIAFSDDEQRIAWQGLRDPFGTNADGSREIFAINIDGTNHMQLTMSAGDSWDPRISDDGSRIAFGSRAAFPPEVNADGEYEVYVVNGDGTGMVRITDSDRESGTSEGGAPASFDISGNGQWVVFTSEGDFAGTNPNNSHTIFWTPSGGSGIEQQIRDQTKPAGVVSLSADQPRASNDGATFFYEASALYSSDSIGGGDKVFAHARQ
jgi:Tol biopolymer transport system component